MLTLYGIPNCDTVKKARDWLQTHDVPYRFHDFKKMGVSSSLLQNWIDQLGLDAIINKRGTTWRKLNPEQQAATDINNAISLIIEYPSLIKRPVLEADNILYIGFNSEDYQRIVSP